MSDELDFLFASHPTTTTPPSSNPNNPNTQTDSSVSAFLDFLEVDDPSTSTTDKTETNIPDEVTSGDDFLSWLDDNTGPKSPVVVIDNDDVVGVGEGKSMIKTEEIKTTETKTEESTTTPPPPPGSTTSTASFSETADPTSIPDVPYTPDVTLLSSLPNTLIPPFLLPLLPQLPQTPLTLPLLLIYESPELALQHLQTYHPYLLKNDFPPATTRRTFTDLLLTYHSPLTHLPSSSSFYDLKQLREDIELSKSKSISSLSLPGEEGSSFSKDFEEGVIKRTYFTGKINN